VRITRIARRDLALIGVVAGTLPWVVMILIPTSRGRRVNLDPVAGREEPELHAAGCQPGRPKTNRTRSRQRAAARTSCQIARYS
jgi:hypothetical protein